MSTMSPKMQISLQRNSSWLADVLYQDFPLSSDQVNLSSGDGQSISLPLSFLVASSPFLQSLLPPPCACLTSPTVLLPSTTGLTLKMLAQIFSKGETEQLAGDTTETYVKSIQEVLGLLGSKVKVVLGIDCVKNVKVVKVVSLAHETSVFKEEIEICDNWDSSLVVNEKVDSDSSHVFGQERKRFSSSTDDFQPTSQTGNLVSSLNRSDRFKDQNGEATSHTRENYESENLDQLNNMVQCPECGLQFGNKSSLKVHVTKKHKLVGDQKESEDFEDDKMGVRCSECKLAFAGRGGLNLHIRRVHEGVVYACGVCHKSVAQKKTIFAHCKAFCHDRKLIYEIKGHSRNAPGMVRCSKCGLLFNNNSLLMKHVADKHKVVGDEEFDESEDNKKRFRCSECKLTFSRKSILNCHIKRFHEGVVYVCGVCHKPFAQMNSMYAHCKKNDHDKDLVYEIEGHSRNAISSGWCSKCDLRFSKNSLLMQHIAEEHKVSEKGGESENNKMRFTCSQCKETFCDRITLNRHSERVHEGVTYACGVCDKFVSEKRKIVAHCKEFGHDKGLIYKIHGSSIEGNESE